MQKFITLRGMNEILVIFRAVEALVINRLLNIKFSLHMKCRQSAKKHQNTTPGTPMIFEPWEPSLAASLSNPKSTFWCDQSYLGYY
ncbi:MAG: hypothetical protein K0B06_00270 [Brevefilum sp.]|nr:hypothetical protein [Brevefilum sp.]